MATTRIGIKRPEDLNVEAGEVYYVYIEETGREYSLHETTDGIGALIGASHDAVGLVTWRRTDSLEEGMRWIDAQLP